MSAFPCDDGSGHDWQVIATLGEVEGVVCDHCGWCRVRDRGTGRFLELCFLDENGERDHERERQLAEAVVKR